MRYGSTHSDEDAKARVQRDFTTLKVDGSGASHKSLLDYENLLSNDGEHLDIDAVEFVEARPCACLCETREKPTWQ